MASLTDVVFYILREYPHKSELSNARTTKIVYLADWRSELQRSRQITNIEWYFDNYGPFVWDIKNTIAHNPAIFSMASTINELGSEKTLFSVKGHDYSPRLSEDEKGVIDWVIKETKSLYWDDFITLIYSTYPVLTGARYTKLDLHSAAAEYKARQKPKPSA